jgi:hypothetical protein
VNTAENLWQLNQINQYKIILYAGKSSKLKGGPATILTKEEEQEIVTTCQALQEIRCGLTKPMVTQVVADYIYKTSRPNNFHNGQPGPDWWDGFLKRWPQLRKRKPEHLSKKRAEDVTRIAIDDWIDKVAEVFKEHGLQGMMADEVAKRLHVECR